MDPAVLVIGGIGVVFVVIWASAIASCYRRTPPDKIMVIGGMGTAKGESSYTVHLPGQGALVWPVIQQAAFLGTQIRTLEVKGAANTKDLQAFHIRLEASFRIEPEAANIKKAIECFMNNEEQIDKTVRSIIISQLNIFSRLYTLDEFDRQWVAFELGLKKGLEQELEKLGIVLIALNAQETSKDSLAESALPFR